MPVLQHHQGGEHVADKQPDGSLEAPVPAQPTGQSNNTVARGLCSITSSLRTTVSNPRGSIKKLSTKGNVFPKLRLSCQIGDSLTKLAQTVVTKTAELDLTLAWYIYCLVSYQMFTSLIFLTKNSQTKNNKRNNT